MSIEELGLHKAKPVTPMDSKTRPTCRGCNHYLKRVPGGKGSVWVHAYSGMIIGEGQKKP